jgi:hypothetical protein
MSRFGELRAVAPNRLGATGRFAAVERRDRMPVLEQTACERAADEPRSSDDQDPHAMNRTPCIAATLSSGTRDKRTRSALCSG